MSHNRNLDAAWQYHSGTKHSYLGVRLHPHALDWENKPLLFKIYPTLEVTRLSRDFRESGVPALDAIAAPAPERQGDSVPTVETLARILFFSAGVTRSKKHDQGETFFRAAACTGALYEIELYVVCSGLRGEEGPGLPAGLYHFGAAEFGLRLLRAGDFRQAVADAAGGDASISRAPVLILSTGTYWRNAWKYRSRTYRHFGWDNGTLLANLLAISAASRLPAKIFAAFVDSQLNALVGVDPHREVALSIAALGHQSSPPPNSPEIVPLDVPVVPYSTSEIEYPAMQKFHDASSLASVAEVTSWRGPTPEHESTAPKGDLFPLRLPDASAIPQDALEKVISRRGSTRQFAREPISFPQLSLMLDRATRGIPADFLEPFGAHLNDLYLIVNHVEGLPSGAYFYRWEQKELELLKAGDFRDKAGYLGLEQRIPADAAVDVFFLADLKTILERYGNRGYRAAQLEAGILGGKLYLAAYAQHLGASGLTFYDDDVVSFFSRHARGKSAIFLVALGRSLRRA